MKTRRFQPGSLASQRFDVVEQLAPAGEVAWTSPDGRCWQSPEYARFRPLFAKAIDRRFYTIEHLDRLILTSRAQCWFGERAAIVTELRTYPTGVNAIHGLVAAGDLAEIAGELIPRAEHWARDQASCAIAMIESRAGWARVLERHGYGAHQTTLIKEL